MYIAFVPLWSDERADLLRLVRIPPESVGRTVKLEELTPFDPLGFDGNKGFVTSDGTVYTTDQTCVKPGGIVQWDRDNFCHVKATSDRCVFTARCALACRNSLVLFNPRTGTPRHTLLSIRHAYSDAVFSRDGKWIAIYSFDWGQDDGFYMSVINVEERPISV